MRFLKSGFTFISIIFLASCAMVPGGEVYISEADRKISQQTPSITLEQIEFEKITATNTKHKTKKNRQPHRNYRLEQQIKNYAYKVGNGDVLQVTVWEHPELLNLGKEGLAAIGFLVDSQGFIFYPYIGRVNVTGKSIYAIRDQLTTALSKYIENPQLAVTVTSFASRKIYLTGQINKPIPLVIKSQAITLLDAINQVGGVNARADLNDIVVIRKGQRRHIDLNAMLHYGDMRQNILLQDNDQIHVASQKPKVAYVMGQATTPLAIPMTADGITLANALGAARGINETTADASAVYVIRESHKANKIAKVYLLDLSNMAAMVLAAKFELNHEDVVYIAKAPIVKWNQLLSTINPALDAAIDLGDAVTAIKSIPN